VEGVNDRYSSTCMQVVQLCSEIHKLINSIWNEKELPQQQKKFVTLPVYEGSAVAVKMSVLMN